MDLFKTISPAEFYLRFLTQGVRPDGRPLHDIRKSTISVGSIKTVVGSSLCKVGDTSVIAGIKADVGPPPTNSSNKLLPTSLPYIQASSSNTLINQIIPINVELSSLCHSRFKPGKPSEEAQVLTEHLQKIMRETSLVDLQSLVIQPGKAMWFLYIDIYCLNHDGNVFDACVMALMSALLNVRLPVAKVSESGENVVVEDPMERPIQLKLNSFPVSLSFAWMNEDFMIVDPTMEEEDLSTARMTIVLDASDEKNSNRICSVWKLGGNPIPPEKFKECMQIALVRAKEVKGIVNKVKQKKF